MTSIIHIYLRRIFARCQANKQTAQARDLIADAVEPKAEAKKRVSACWVCCIQNKVRRRRSTPSGARGPGFLGVSECRAEFARREWVPVEGGGVARLSAGRKIGDYGRDVTILGWVEQ